MIAPHIAAWALNKRKDASDHAHVVVADTAVMDLPRRKKKKSTRVDEPAVLQTKGGGGYVPPPQPSPMEQAQAREWENNQDFEREQRRQEAEDKRIAAEKADKLAKWNTGRSTAFRQAQDLGRQRIQQLGLDVGDEYGIYNDYINRINAANASLQEEGDYASAFSPTIFDEVVGGARTSTRNKLRSSFNQGIDPFYAEDLFSSTSDDAILASILGEQYNSAIEDLGAARDRGQVSNIIYDRALRDLGTTKNTANSELQKLGGTVLSGITDEFGNRRTRALDDISAWDFGDSPFDVEGTTRRLKDYATTRQSGLEGDIRAAVGGREFFDIPGLIGKASARAGNQTTGTSNTGASALYDTFANEAQKKSEATKSNEGIF